MADYNIPTVVHQSIPQSFMAPLEEWLLCSIFEREINDGSIYFFASDAPASDLEVVPELGSIIEESRALCPDLCKAVEREIHNVVGNPTTIDADIIGWPTVLQGIVQRHRDELPYVTAEASFTCSKMRSDGWGGMAVLITPDEVVSVSTMEWLTQQIAARSLSEPEPKEQETTDGQ